MCSRPLNLAILVALSFWASAAQASESAIHLAYLDPGTGSLIIQALIAVVAGALVTMNIYWARIKAFFGKGKPTEETESKRPTSGDG